MFTEKLPPTVISLLKTVGKYLPAKTYLAGGTALALHLNHRTSYDLDFYSPRKFKPENIKVQLESSVRDYGMTSISWQTLIGKVKDTEISLFYYQYPLLKDTVALESTTVASLEDIAAMKLEAIAGRGLKRDFFDIYSICTIKGWALGDILNMNLQKYDEKNDHKPHVLKSLTYFDDAEKYSERVAEIEAQWAEVKTAFQKWAKTL